MTEAASHLPIYFPRSFHLHQEDGNPRRISEAELLALPGAKVVLGEPGMGKSEFMAAAGRLLDVGPVAASQFMLSKRPERMLSDGKPLLIDGLDEAMARKHGDAIDLVLTQLANLDCPDFILTCRSQDWQARAATNLHRTYGTPVHIATMEPFTRDEAVEFLQWRFPAVVPELVLSHLDQHDIADLYTNPLTLGLMAKVANADSTLPATRAALFERVCALTWPEHNAERHDLALGQLSANTALSAAGAIMASLLLAGMDDLVVRGPGEHGEDIRLADIKVLPGAEAAELVAGSKLFVSAGTGRMRPLHRVIAEYLGARWLTECASSPRLIRRLLAHFQDGGAVPVSLRGLHAWLAYHCPQMTEQVIAADPFGVLQYGEIGQFSSSDISGLFAALQQLAANDPYFMRQSRGLRSAGGLMIAPLQDKVEAAIATTDANGHLRMLLLEGLIGTAMAGSISATLETILFSAERWYSERRDASLALKPHRDLIWWEQSIVRLHDEVSEDASRLARQMIEDVACAVSDDVVVSVIFAELNLSICPFPRAPQTDIGTYRDYRKLVQLLPAVRMAPVLDMLSGCATLLTAERLSGVDLSDVSKIASALLVRAIGEDIATVANVAAVWKWLSLATVEEQLYKGEQTVLQLTLRGNDDLRRALQEHALHSLFSDQGIWRAELQLQRRLIGLCQSRSDMVGFFERLREADSSDLQARKAWRDLMELVAITNGWHPDVRTASRLFQRDDPELAAIAFQLEHPAKPEWMIDEERRKEESELQHRSAQATRQQAFQDRLEDLRNGEWSVTPQAAQMYLGLFYNAAKISDARERLANWIGEDLAHHALTGFENSLFRTDLPTPSETAASLVSSKMWNHGYSIVAGLHARQAAGIGFDDVSYDVLQSGLMLAYDGRCCGSRDPLQTLVVALEPLVLSDDDRRQQFARLWIEPALEAKATYVDALHRFSRGEHWCDAALRLVPAWLQRYRDLPLDTERALIDSIAYPSSSAELAAVSRTRLATPGTSNDRNLLWSAVDMIVRFDEALPELTAVAALHPELLFFIRDRLHQHAPHHAFSLSINQELWLVATFRKVWPYASPLGGFVGDRNPHEASSFLRSIITRIADDTTDAAMTALQYLTAGEHDTHTDFVRHMAVEQRQKHAEKSYSTIGPSALAALLSDGPPATIDDLKALVLEELALAQKILKGSDLDQARDFWNDQHIPHGENRCRDRLAAMIETNLTRYGIQRITEADMPHTKRVDLAFAHGSMQLPMEVKGQWHDDVWGAATSQLDAQYLIDWRSQDRGVYCVLWFGDLPANTGRRLKPPPNGMTSPITATAMQETITALIPAARRHLIDVVVLDFTGSAGAA